MTKHQRYDLTFALDCLNDLIEQGHQFSKAVDMTLEFVAVDRTKLIAFYDSQDPHRWAVIAEINAMFKFQKAS
ncbi:hypothetical protein ACKFKF_30850 [Phormidesmis sp. 146-12]